MLRVFPGISACMLLVGLACLPAQVFGIEMPKMQKDGTMEIKMPKSTWDKKSGDYKAGDFVEQEFPATPGMKMRKEILEVGDHFIVISTKTIVSGHTMEQKAKWLFTEADPDKTVLSDKKIETKEAADTVKVGDKELSATRYEAYIDGKFTGKSWISKEIPIDGLAKAEGPDGKATLVTTSFGRGK